MFVDWSGRIFSSKWFDGYDARLKFTIFFLFGFLALLFVGLFDRRNYILFKDCTLRNLNVLSMIKIFVWNWFNALLENRGMHLDQIGVPTSILVGVSFLCVLFLFILSVVWLDWFVWFFNWVSLVVKEWTSLIFFLILSFHLFIKKNYIYFFF